MSFHCTTNYNSLQHSLCGITSNTTSFPIPTLKLKCNTINNRFKILAKSNSDDAPTSTTPTSLLSFLCPLLKLFSGGDPSGQRNFALELATSSLASTSRFAWGRKSVIESASTKEIASEPPISLQLFEFEACPFCRRVREAMTELDLSVEVYPCPKGSVRHREVVRKTGGKEMFPFLIDQNSGVSMYESSDIVKYLFERYGEGRSPSLGLLESTIFTGWMPTILRAGRGMTLWERSRLESPPRKLELFSYENNPNARIVREALCELELPYILQNVGEGSRRMKLLVDASGSKEVPYFVDHNTGFQSGSFNLDVLKEAFQLKETTHIDLPAADKGIPTIAGKSKSEKDKEKKHKKHKDRDRDKDKDKEHKKHKHRHKDRSKDKDKEKKKDKSGHRDSSADHSKKHHEKKRKHDGDDDVNDVHKHKKSKHKSSRIDELGAIKVAG